MPISLAIIDLDNFKLLNDGYGHQAGDDCLKSAGSILQGFSKRPSDLCARYGGEEFAIVFGNTQQKQAEVFVRKLLDAIRSLNIPNEQSPILPILTASIGFATMFPNNDISVSDLIKKADENLYLAKENGKNQVSF